MSPLHLLEMFNLFDLVSSRVLHLASTGVYASITLHACIMHIDKSSQLSYRFLRINIGVQVSFNGELGFSLKPKDCSTVMVTK